jgi:hypothetical protein
VIGNEYRRTEGWRQMQETDTARKKENLDGRNGNKKTFFIEFQWTCP